MRNTHQKSKEHLEQMEDSALMNHFYKVRHQVWVRAVISKYSPAKLHIAPNVTQNYLRTLKNIIDKRGLKTAG